MCHKSLKLHQTVKKVDYRRKNAVNKKKAATQVKLNADEKFFLKHEEVLN
jgi:hypothetical protein